MLALDDVVLYGRMYISWDVMYNLGINEKLETAQIQRVLLSWSWRSYIPIYSHAKKCKL